MFVDCVPRMAASNLDRPCTGYRCEYAQRCRHYQSKPAHDYMSPLSTGDACPHFDELLQQWGDGPDRQESSN